MSSDTELTNTDFVEADAERSVSDLLSTFYNVDDLQNADPHAKGSRRNSEIQDSEDDVIVSGTVFSQEDFDLESCLDTALKKYSMVDLIALLRRLEREVRQFTAGKQLLIYDNYECLFTALDTVHEINGELTVVQKHLQALKTSQIKASSIDISSRYGIRDKLLRISELNRVLNVFQTLASMATCLSEAKRKTTRSHMDKQCLSNLLEIIAKIHVILNALKEHAGPKVQQIKLLHTFNKYIKELIPNVIKAVNRIFREECLTHEELISMCSNLARSHMKGRQVWDYYWVNKSLWFRNRLERLVKAVKSSTVTLYTLSNDIIDFLLCLVETVYSEEYLNLTKCVETNNRYRKGSSDTDSEDGSEACIFCTDNNDHVIFVDGKNIADCSTHEGGIDDDESTTYSYYFIKSPPGHKCMCVRDNIAHQFVACYLQLAFAALQHRIMNRSKIGNTNELIFVLTAILDRIKNIRKEDPTVRNLIDMSYKWMFSIVLLYVQKSFYPVYDTWADAILCPLENKERDIFKSVGDMIECILKDDVNDLLNFVDDLGIAMHQSLRPVYSSFVIFYIMYLKHLVGALYKGIVAIYRNKCEDSCHLSSISSLIALRGSSGLIREDRVSEHKEMASSGLKMTNSDRDMSIAQEDGKVIDSELDEIKVGLSVDYYIECMLKRKTEKWSSTKSSMRNMLTHIIVSIYRFDSLFKVILKRSAEKMGRLSTLVTSSDLQVIMPQQTYASSQVVTPIQQSIYMADLPKCVSASQYLEGLFGNHSGHLTCMIYAIHRFDKEGSLTGLIPLIKTAEDVNNTLNEPKNTVELVEVDSLQLTQSILSYVMYGYITIANTLIRCTMESIESGSTTAETTIKDFTGMMYDMIEFLNATSDAALGDETTQMKISETHKHLNDIIEGHDVHMLNSIYEFPFLPSKEFCLKLFTILIAQSISRTAKQHVMKVEHLTGILSRIEMQLLVTFRKSSDIDQMKRAFGQLAYPDVM